MKDQALQCLALPICCVLIINMEQDRLLWLHGASWKSTGGSELQECAPLSPYCHRCPRQPPPIYLPGAGTGSSPVVCSPPHWGTLQRKKLNKARCYRCFFNNSSFQITFPMLSASATDWCDSVKWMTCVGSSTWPYYAWHPPKTRNDPIELYKSKSSAT